MADDTTALLRHIGIEHADIFGYSMGAGIALQIAIEHPDLVRKLVVAAVTYNRDGSHPGILAGIESLTPEPSLGPRSKKNTPGRRQIRQIGPGFSPK
jgi:pimeloyl-ACP methyl ester carboxylesterase